MKRIVGLASFKAEVGYERQISVNGEGNILQFVLEFGGTEEHNEENGWDSQL